MLKVATTAATMRATTTHTAATSGFLLRSFISLRTAGVWLLSVATLATTPLFADDLSESLDNLAHFFVCDVAEAFP